MVLKANFYSGWLLTVSLAIFIFSCSDKNDPEPKPVEGNLVTATSTGSWTVDNLKFFIQLSGRDIDPNLFEYDVDVYRVIYKTTYQNTEIDASGLVLLPKTTEAIPMISFQHGTIVLQSEAPSVQELEGEQVISYSALAAMGFITVVPDMLGFGKSKDIFHPYYIEEPTATAVVDLMRAATKLAEQKQVEFNSRLFLAGYSQGGYATLATHKAMESNPVEGFELVASFPGAGGYDLSGMLGYFAGIDNYPDPYYLAYVGMSYQSYYDEDGLVNGFFNEPYAGKIPSLFNGTTPRGEINSQLTDDIPALVKEDALLNTGTHPVNIFLMEKFEENSLVDWVPVAPIFLYHGDADITVPIENSQATYDRLLDNGAGADNLELIILPGRNHDTAVEPYIVDVVTKLQALK